ncbi:anti-sigma factor family protein [Candidatus Epulonipiscium viviparus]|uniref:anti-sigma factor family protein n=1 Tax=Candidatus Epulonipiscium viviparus TaxID=420336 RepID=UPI00016C0B7B|nr:zf-HC2 domain-containing protein [Candidatus Epulopiscium viviparus]
MKCDLEQLSLYIDEELEPSQRLEIEEHLKTCDDCQSNLQLLLEIKEQLSMLDEVPLPDNFHSELMNKIAPKKHNYTKYYLSAASVLAICVVGISTFFNQPAEQSPVPMMYSTPPVAARNIPSEEEHLGNPVSYIVELNAPNKDVVDKLRRILDEQELNYFDMSIDGVLHYIINSESDYAILADYLRENASDFNQTPVLDSLIDPVMIELIIHYP